MFPPKIDGTNNTHSRLAAGRHVRMTILTLSKSNTHAISTTGKSLTKKVGKAKVAVCKITSGVGHDTVLSVF